MQRWYCVHVGPEVATAEVVLREVNYAWARLQTVCLLPRCVECCMC
jgi:hypothetical protein